MISHPRLANLNPDPAAPPESASVFIIECPACGYEPDDQLFLRTMRCPKCYRFAWRQRPRPGMLREKPAAGPGAATA